MMRKIYTIYKTLVYLLFLASSQKKVFRIHAIRRSGQHAIISWMKSNINGSYLFFNNVYNNNNIYTSSDHIEAKYRPLKSKKIIYNIENSLFNEHYALKKDSEKGIGNNSEFVDIIILRDPFNQFSSYLNAKWPWDSFFQDYSGYRMFLRDVWKLHAREFLGESNFFKNKVVINYNQWTHDITYRQTLSKKLAIDGFNKLDHSNLDFGLGSSFKNQGDNDTSFLTRWKVSKEDERFLQMIRDPELVRLSNKIFGEIEGTRELYS